MYVWKGHGDHDSFDEEWVTIVTCLTMAIIERCVTLQGVGGQLDRGIDMERILVNVFARENLTLRSMLRLPIDIAEEVQCTYKMLKFVAISATQRFP